MSRALFMAVALALMPEACTKLMGKKAPPVTEADPEPPQPVASPITSATTPPIWHPPEGPPPITSGSAVPAASPAPVVSPELVKARAAADAKDFKKVRALLEKKARSSKSTPEESQLVFRACTALKDKACADAVKAKHPDDFTE